MVEPRDPHREETEDPRNPPQAILNKDVRRGALASYLGPLVVLVVVLGLVLLYWVRREPGRDDDPNTLNPTIGTTGEKVNERQVDRQEQLQQGGGDPASRPDSTKDDIESRGGAR